MKVKNIFAAILCVIPLAGCGAKSGTNEYSETVFAMDTVMELKAYGANAPDALEKAKNETLRLDNALSRGNAGSDIGKINALGSAEVSEETASLVSRAVGISAETNGAFDITIAPVMDLWGFFDRQYRVPPKGELEEALKSVDYHNISVNGQSVSVQNGSQLDLGGIAKGYLSGRIIDIFRECGVSSAIVSLGGNVHCLGPKPDSSPWRVAIQNPLGDGSIGILSVTDKAVITSGGYQRYFESDGVVYHHIIDHATGSSARSGLCSVSIITADSTRADGLSTALFVMGLDRASEFWRENRDFEMVLVTDDGDIYISEGLDRIFESNYNYSVIK